MIVPSLENFDYYVDNIQDVLNIQISNNSDSKLTQPDQPLIFKIVENSDESQLAETF